MHAVLYIPELLAEIFQHVAAADGTPARALHRRTSDLATLARVCRAFSAPALALLWRRLNTLAPLVALFPPENACTLEQQHRVRGYARHIRQLSIDDARDADACARLARLPRRPNELPLLPHLVSVWWDAATPAGLAGLTRVLSPSLRDLSLSVDAGPCAPDAALAHLCTVLTAPARPKLRHLALGGTAALAPHTAARLLVLLRAQPELASLRLDDTLAHHPALVPALGGLSHLSALHLTLRAPAPRCALRPPVAHAPPLAVRTLVLDGEARAITAFARRLPRAPLDDVVVTLFRAADKRDEAEMRSALEGVCVGGRGRLEVGSVLDGGDGSAARRSGGGRQGGSGTLQRGAHVGKADGEEEEEEEDDSGEEDEDGYSEDEDDILLDGDGLPLAVGPTVPFLTALGAALAAPVRLAPCDAACCQCPWHGGCAKALVVG